MPRAGWIDGRSERLVYLTAAYALISILIAMYAVLGTLWATHALEKRHFSLSRLNFASQVVAVSSQTLVVALLSGITYVTQTIASDTILRRRKHSF